MNLSTVAKVWLFGLLTGIALVVTEAAFNQITVRDDNGVIFRVRRFDDEREQLYRLVIKTNITSIFVIKFGGQVTSFMAGPENFRLEFAPNGNLAGVVPMPHGDPVNLSDPTVPLDYACNDCEEAWDDVCLSAEAFICTLVGNPVVSTIDSQDTLNTACVQFVALCDRLNAEAACSGNCIEGMKAK